MLKKIQDLTLEDVKGICDHTFLNRSEGYLEQAKKLGKSCMYLREEEFNDFLIQSIRLNPFAVCVRPEDVSRTHLELGHEESQIQIASVVGFPDGAWYDTEAKVSDTGVAIENGADEIDMVLNYGLLKGGAYREVKNDIEKVVNFAHKEDTLVKLILETSELDPEQIKTACKIAEDCNVDFIKTSTGFGAYGARVEDLKIMRDNFGRGIKISGGVNKDNYKDLLAAATERNDGYIELDPMEIRIGESSLLK